MEHSTFSLRTSSTFLFCHDLIEGRALIFMSRSGKGISITYPTISLHAISRSEFGPSIYCQLDETIDMEVEPTPDEQDAMELRELRINTTESSRKTVSFLSNVG